MEQIRKFRMWGAATAVLLLFQLGLMLAMSASERLHHRLHADAGHADHECEVTLLASGALDEALVPPVIVAPAPEVELPAALPSRTDAGVTATHLLGGVLAQSPPRGP